MGFIACANRTFMEIDLVQARLGRNFSNLSRVEGFQIRRNNFQVSIALKDTRISVLSAIEGEIMLVRLRPQLAALGLVALLLSPGANPGLAVTADVARKCSALMAKQFPPREPGNPAAGSAKGSGRDQQAFYNKCVANGGKVDDSSGK
jgi:hypothetical protein